jgi:hypothetical protein
MLGPGVEGSRGISMLRHPQYVLNQENWEKWRLTYLGGSRFIKRFLKKFSNREDDQAFRDRMAVSYCPAFAKAAIDEVKNSIFQRLADIIREGGPKSYQDAVEGLSGGVDKSGTSMTTFMGRDVLPELLTMARVGVYVDMPPLEETTTLAERRAGDRPYLYWYKAEDICSWSMQDPVAGDPTEFRAVLLRDSAYSIDEHWVLPYEITNRFRYVYIGDDGYVRVQFYVQTDPEAKTAPRFVGGPAASYPTAGQDGWEAQGGEIKLKLKRIPFVLLQLSDSLLADVADYQISLLNLASSDINYALKSNYPFYVEQYDWKAEAPYLKPSVPGGMVATNQTSLDPTTAAVIVSQEKVREVKVGSATGRRYPMGVERPGFIHPSSEPLAISMKKQEQLKLEIRQLVHLAVSTLAATRQSAESQDHDTQGLEAGLSYIGLELQHAERKVAEFWALYEGATEAGSVHYPTQYSLLSDADRRAAAAELKDLMPMVPSLTFRREVSKRIVDIILGSKVRADVLRSIKDEIDNDPVVIGDPMVIEQDVINGLVDLETASLARGYPKGVVERAKADHADRLARINESQAQAAAIQQAIKAGASDPGARGVPDLSANPNAARDEKALSQREQSNRPDVRKRTRGKAK